MISPGVVEVETRIAARPETVFSFFTDPEKYRLWKGVDAELDPRPGGLYRVAMNERTDVRGEYLVVEPPSRIVFTWGWESLVEPPEGIREVKPGSTTVEITLTPEGDGTILRLRHTDLPTDAARETHDLGWATYLDRLAAAAAGRDPGPDPLPSLLATLRARADLGVRPGGVNPKASPSGRHSGA